MQTLAALLTPTIAAVAIIIAFMQWRTAHQKVVLDLFELRSAAYQKLSDAAVLLITEGTNVDNPSRQLAKEGLLASKFLFGEDAFAEINAFAKAVSGFKHIPAEIRLHETEKAREMDGANTECMIIAKRFLERMPSLFEPYMRMDQKLIRTPAQWLRDRNRIRLSYADEQQIR